MKKRVLSMFVAFTIVLSVLQVWVPITIPEVSSLTTPVWKPDLTNATTDGTGRNYITDSQGRGFGFLTGSSSTDDSGQQLFVENGKIRYTNKRSNFMPLRIVTAAPIGFNTATSAWSEELGFKPKDSKKYLLRFTATDETGNAPGKFVFSTDGSANFGRDEDEAKPISGNTFEREFEWPNPNGLYYNGDGPHGVPIIGMCTPLWRDEVITVIFSDFEIYEAEPCKVCGEIPCVCECPIIFIPGMMGSRLFTSNDTFKSSTQLWDPERNYNGIKSIGNKLKNDTLYVRPPENMKDKGVEPEYGAQEEYKNLIDGLLSSPKLKNRKIYFFSYDWRQDNNDSAQKLKKIS